MKKLIASIIAIIAINASAYDVTNTVTIVTNIYRRIGEKHYVTNTTINLDVSQQAIDAARAQANRAASFADDALDHAEEAAASATTAQSHAADAKDYRDEAEYYMEQAHGQVQPIIDEGQRQLAAVQSAGNTQVSRVASEGTFQYNRVNSAGSSNVGSVNSAGQTALNNINAKQQWFDDNYGKMITNYNYYSANRLERDVSPRSVCRYYFHLNGVKHPEKWIEIDFSSRTQDSYWWIYRYEQSSSNSNSDYSKIFDGRRTGYVTRNNVGDSSDISVIDGYFNIRAYASSYYKSDTFAMDISIPRTMTLYYYGSSTAHTDHQYILAEESIPWYVNADLTITDKSSGIVIGRIIRDADLNNLSNWVERVFQKK